MLMVKLVDDLVKLCCQCSVCAMSLLVCSQRWTSVQVHRVRMAANALTCSTVTPATVCLISTQVSTVRQVLLPFHLLH